MSKMRPILGKAVRRSVAVISLVFLTGGVVQAHQSPEHCAEGPEPVGFTISVAGDKAQIVSGETVTYTVTLTVYTCDAFGIGIVLTCPGADGSASGGSIPAASGESISAGGSKSYPGLSCVVTVNPGVTQATARVDFSVSSHASEPDPLPAISYLIHRVSVVDCEASPESPTWYQDADGDGYGNASVSIQACDQPSGYVGNSTDCNDSDAGIHPGGTELCNNGVDDDCDGQVDETTIWYPDSDGDSYGNSAVSTEACDQPFGYVDNAADCDDSDGGVYPGATEVCNLKDDDCDGQIDEGSIGPVWYGDADGDGFGTASVSAQACSQPSGYADNSTDCDDADAAIHPGAGEICDGFDNDCDGTIDEGNPGGDLPCDTGQPGACAAGTTICSNGSISCSQDVQPSDETCDLVDNDCDGTVDDGNPGGGVHCDTGLLGVCADGTTTCSNGSVNCVQNEPSPEACDGLDNDCDGTVDNGNPGGGVSCDTGHLGVCAAGTTNCLNGSVSCVQDVQSSSEACDGLDNDCDGSVDNGNPGGGLACNTGKPGVCAAGTTVCSNSSVSCTQSVQPSAEICDSLDNDCDGTVDNGNPGGGEACNTGLPGLCAAGTTTCSNGAISCGPDNSSAETCDGLDNDCDGAVDEGNPDGGQACNTELMGVCAAGTTICSNGSVSCSQNVQPSAEICDALDNDCDGSVDDGNPDGGIACSTLQPGVCAAGVTVCSGGSLSCVPIAGPSPEICDGLDNDCDGLTDEGNPGGGLACSTGLPGVCAAGTTICSNGTVTCSQNVPPSAESCDTLDNDCDGAVDEGGVCTVAPLLTSLSPARVWVGLQNSADAGIRFDLAAKVYLNNVEVGSGQLDGVAGGSSGFDNAKLNTIKLNLSAPVSAPSGSSFQIEVLVRNACRKSGKNSGRATLWYNGQPIDRGPRADAGTRFDANIGGTKRDYFLRQSAALSTTAGSSRLSVDQDAGSPCSAFKSFGSWTTALP